ncbi:MAG: hypothetical protein LBQ09_09675 [Acidobacteriaceae bacterium]|jgi:outer membrane protein W|nr:hypothetical protein [Acidobacteriaceae bacterium]
MRRVSSILSITIVLCALSATAAHAQQSLNLSFGTFSIKGASSRAVTNGISDDVLVNDQDLFAFNIKDFNGLTFGADYLIGINDFIDAGLGIGYYQKTVPSVYLDFVNSDGSEIEQNLRLRITPLTATFRVLPLGRQAPFQPYVGAGVGFFSYKYSETGDFIFTDNSVGSGNYVGSGWATGPVILGGVRFPLGTVEIGGEVRWQHAVGNLPADQGFAGSKIDLGGWTYVTTFNIHF